LARGARMRLDPVSGEPVLLYPEGVLPLDESTFAIIQLCSGNKTVAEVVAALAEEYDTDRNTLLGHVTECLEQLEEKLLIVFASEPQTEPDRVQSLQLPAKSEKARKKSALEYRPYLLLAELTYRCPLHCPYCSNPSSYPNGQELSTADWRRVLHEAASLGVLHVGFSGGEPLQRQDLTDLIAAARDAGLYSNLITSAIGLTRQRAAELKRAGLDNVQISFQSDEESLGNRIAGANVHVKKLEAARLVRDLGFPLTVNVVLHRANISRLDQIIRMAEALGAERLELANTQYYGWAFQNRAALLPSREQIEAATQIALAARRRLAGRMDLLFVVPDYYSTRPKPCMHGWGSRFLTVNPVGQVLPCPTATSIKGLDFDNVREHSIKWIWRNSEAFNRFRGTQWMPLPCRECEFREVDFGGCRCQAALIAGDSFATDPACELSPHRSKLDDFVRSLQRPARLPAANALEDLSFRQNPESTRK
jgi:PqqA peptide cyclase